MEGDILHIPGKILSNLPLIWTFTLLCVRFAGLLTVMPGIGMGERGMLIRMPAIVVLAYASMITGANAALPVDPVMMTAAVSSEFLLGLMLGMVPLMVVAGVQTAAQIAGTSMGIGVGNLVDPTLGIQVADLSRIIGDITVILFLLMGGHHVIVHAVSGLGGQIIPGTYLVQEASMQAFIARSADIFRVGVIVSAPVVVALLLTQFVMGLVTKAVPTVNIFIVSFPLTIGIGLILTMLALPDIAQVMSQHIIGIEAGVFDIVRDTKTLPPKP